VKITYFKIKNIKYYKIEFQSREGGPKFRPILGHSDPDSDDK